jgi:hypothetical protein
MLILLSSPTALAPKGSADAALAQVFIDAKKAGNPVAVLSNHQEPAWFKSTFHSSGVQFIRAPGRQNGKILVENAARLKLAPHDVLVLAATPADIQMGKNGGAVVAAAAWSTDAQVLGLGVRVQDSAELSELVKVTGAWPGVWWFVANSKEYRVRALADLSGYYKPLSQQEFAAKVTQTVKSGGPRLNALLAITARSLLTDGLGNQAEQVWGVYPSSKSKNNDTEVLSDFTHRLRTTVSRVRHAKIGEPLFIRHTPSAKRSAGGGGSRTDPTDQVESIHLNPFYGENKRLVGKHIVVVDDCMTYGLSFGVAAALLRKAGAAQVTGVALGKFGNQLHHFDMEVVGDPFKPMTGKDAKVKSTLLWSGKSDTAAQSILHSLIP